MINFFYINWVFLWEVLFLISLGLFCLGLGGMNIEAVLHWTSGCPVSLLHKMGFAMSSACIAQGFIQSALENLQGLELLHRSEQSVLLLD